MNLDSDMRDAFQKFMTDDDVELIIETEQRDIVHPVKALLSLDNQRTEWTKGSTRQAILSIMDENEEWLKSLKSRLLNTKDYSDATSALAEIRAYGNLLYAGFDIKPVPTSSGSTPDFLIEAEDLQIRVEVYAKGLDGENAQELNRFHTDPLIPREAEKVAVREISVSPFGKIKKGELTTENAISRIASIKQDEKQFDATSTNILWIDLQDEIWFFDGYLTSKPIFGGTTGKYRSGYIWYAFYGEKDLPIFERASFERKTIKQGTGMQHDGRYFLREGELFKSIIDFVVVSYRRHNIILENPNRAHNFTKDTWRKLACIPCVDITNSWLDWPDENLESRIRISKEQIVAFNNEGMYSW